MEKRNHRVVTRTTTTSTKVTSQDLTDNNGDALPSIDSRVCSLPHPVNKVRRTTYETWDE